MRRVREVSCFMGWCLMLDWPRGRCCKGFPLLRPGVWGAVRADPCSSWPLPSAGTCLSSKCKQKDKKQKHQQERGLTAKLCRNQMSFFIAFSPPVTWVIAPLFLWVGEHLPSNQKSGLGQIWATIAVGFWLQACSTTCVSVWQWHTRVTGDSHEFLCRRRYCPATWGSIPLETRFSAP